MIKVITGQNSTDELFLSYGTEKESIKKRLSSCEISQEKRVRLEFRLKDLEKRLIPKVISRIRDERKYEQEG